MRPSRKWTPSCECCLRHSTPPAPANAPRSGKGDEASALKELSELGHFLKGSSATLGLTKVKDSCEKIQHYGQLKDDSGTKVITEEESRKKLATIIEQAKKEFADVEKVLKEFYHDDGP